MTTQTIESVLVVLMFFVFWLLRNNIYFGFLWRWTKIFFVVLTLTLFADKIKNDLKSWWNKD